MRIFIYLSVLLQLSCVSATFWNGDSSSEKIPQSERKGQDNITRVSDSATSGETIAKEETCIPFGQYIDKVPFYMADKGVVVNNLLKLCKTSSGEQGYENDSDLTLMGFPCTGGRGRLEWKGSAVNPNLLIFEIDNACPMVAIDKAAIESQIREKFGLLESAKLLAYYPFSLLFWELDDGSDADTSYTVEVLTRSPEGKIKLKTFRSGEPLRVNMYGKANAFLQSRHWYKVDAEIYSDGRYGFRIIVNMVKVLSQDELLGLKQRCESLRPMRRCDQVFAGID